MEFSRQDHPQSNVALKLSVNGACLVLHYPFSSKCTASFGIAKVDLAWISNVVALRGPIGLMGAAAWLEIVRGLLLAANTESLVELEKLF